MALKVLDDNGNEITNPVDGQAGVTFGCRWRYDGAKADWMFVKRQYLPF